MAAVGLTGGSQTQKVQTAMLSVSFAGGSGPGIAHQFFTGLVALRKPVAAAARSQSHISIRPCANQLQSLLVLQLLSQFALLNDFCEPVRRLSPRSHFCFPCVGLVVKTCRVDEESGR